MKNTRKVRNRGIVGDREENGRGIIKVQKKIIRRLEHRVKHLERMLNLAEREEIVIDNRETPELPKGAICKKCESTNIKVVTVEKPGGDLSFLVCQECRNREKL